MIRLNKVQPPELLTENKEQWDEEYRRAIESGKKPPRHYGRREIKEALKSETNDKCAYCESKSLSTHWGEVEHILPKVNHGDLVHEWSNLTLVCSICNNNKLDYDENPSLINPYIENPEDFLVAQGPMITNIPGQVRGEVTERIIGLNRRDLLFDRLKKIESIKNLIERWHQSTGDVKEFLREQIREEVNSDKEFSFVLSKFVSDSIVE